MTWRKSYDKFHSRKKIESFDIISNLPVLRGIVTLKTKIVNMEAFLCYIYLVLKKAAFHKRFVKHNIILHNNSFRHLWRTRLFHWNFAKLNKSSWSTYEGCFFIELNFNKFHCFDRKRGSESVYWNIVLCPFFQFSKVFLPSVWNKLLRPLFLNKSLTSLLHGEI